MILSTLPSRNLGTWWGPASLWNSLLELICAPLLEKYRSCSRDHADPRCPSMSDRESQEARQARNLARASRSPVPPTDRKQPAGKRIQ
jgi:hypothetical protein